MHQGFAADLSADADDNTLVVLLVVDVQHSLPAELLEVQLIALVVVCRYGLGVVVHLHVNYTDKISTHTGPRLMIAPDTKRVYLQRHIGFDARLAFAGFVRFPCPEANGHNRCNCLEVNVDLGVIICGFTIVVK